MSDCDVDIFVAHDNIMDLETVKSDSVEAPQSALRIDDLASAASSEPH